VVTVSDWFSVEFFRKTHDIKQAFHAQAEEEAQQAMFTKLSNKAADDAVKVC
jgi:hypothetical protein